MARSQASRLAACLAAAAVAAVGCGNAPDASRSLAPLDAGVARVQVVWWDTTGAQHSRAFGTAFRVGSQGDLLTAHHVAANARAQRERLGPQTQAKIHVAFDPTPEPGSEADGSLSVEVAITAEDRGVDLALLRIVPPRPDGGGASGGRGSAGGISQRGVARFASSPTPTESVVTVVGYPIGERDLVVRSGTLLDPASIARSLGAFPSWLDELLRDDAVLLADVETRLGNSGSPIYLEESGEVIGLCSAVLLRDALARGELIPLPNPPGAPITVIIAAQRIQRFLDAHGVSAR